MKEKTPMTGKTLEIEESRPVERDKRKDV